MPDRARHPSRLRRRLLQPALVSVLLVTALCAVAQTASASTSPSGTPVVTKTDTTDQIINDHLFNPCGEEIVINGFIHLTTTTLTYPDGSINFKAVLYWDKVSGFGVETGAFYRVIYVVKDTFTASGTTQAFDQVNQGAFVLWPVTAGTPTPTATATARGAYVFVNFHMRVDAQGQLTTYVDQLRAGCIPFGLRLPGV